MADEQPGENRAHPNPLTPIEYADAVVAPGSSEHQRVLAALGRHGFGQQWTFRRPARRHSSVVLAASNARSICIKFYDHSPSASWKCSSERLLAHVKALSALRGRVPVPHTLVAAMEPDDFGLPTLVTTAVAETPVKDAIAAAAGPARKELATSIAAALAALTEVTPTDVAMPDCSIDEIERQFGAMLQEEIQWYDDWLGAKGKRRGLGCHDLVRRGQQVFANGAPPLQKPCLVHSDLGVNNITSSATQPVAIIDWDLARIGSPADDLGKFLARSLIDVPIPREQRLDLVRFFIGSYCSQREGAGPEVLPGALILALSEALYKMAVREQDEAVWVAEMMLKELDDNGSVLRSGRQGASTDADRPGC